MILFKGSTMKILSFRSSTRHLDHGHRPLNLDNALQNKGIEMSIIEEWRTWKISSKLIKHLNPWQVANHIRLFKFVNNKSPERYFLIHGIQNEDLISHLNQFNLPIILDFRDDPVLQSQELNLPIDINSLVKKISYNFDKSDLILFPSKSLLDYHKCHDKGIVVMNASDPNHFKQRDEIKANHRILCLNPPYPANFFPKLFDACLLARRVINDLEIHVVDINKKKYDAVYGEFTSKLKIKYNYSWIKYFDPVPYNAISSLMNNYQIAVIGIEKSQYADMGTSLKLFDHMAAGQPYIITNCKEMAAITRNENCGLVCDFTAEDMADKIISLISDIDLCVKLGRNGRAAIVERHSWQHRANDIKHEITEIAKN